MGKRLQNFILKGFKSGPVFFYQFFIFIFISSKGGTSIDFYACSRVQEIRQAAEFLELPQLLMVLGTLQTRDQFNNDLNNRYKQVVRQRLEDICLEQGTLLL